MTMMMSFVTRPTRFRFTVDETGVQNRRRNTPVVATFASGRGRGGGGEPDGSRVQGGLTKKRCDCCSGTGLVLCPTCNDTGRTGWTIDGNTQRCDRKGYVEEYGGGGLFGIGAKKIGEKKCPRCNDGRKNARPGSITCGRCGGNKFLYYRSADWR